MLHFNQVMVLALLLDVINTFISRSGEHETRCLKHFPFEDAKAVSLLEFLDPRDEVNNCCQSC